MKQARIEWQGQVRDVLVNERDQVRLNDGTILKEGEFRWLPPADGTLFAVDAGEEHYAGLLTLSDVYGTGFHAALTGGAGAGTTVAVIGDGAVGLLAVLSARQLGADRIILMGRHEARTDLGREYTDGLAAMDVDVETAKRVALQGIDIAWCDEREKAALRARFRAEMLALDALLEV